MGLRERLQAQAEAYEQQSAAAAAAAPRLRSEATLLAETQKHAFDAALEGAPRLTAQLPAPMGAAVRTVACELMEVASDKFSDAIQQRLIDAAKAEHRAALLQGFADELRKLAEDAPSDALLTFDLPSARAAG